jgi:hypothetical protein
MIGVPINHFLLPTTLFWQAQILVFFWIKKCFRCFFVKNLFFLCFINQSKGLLIVYFLKISSKI